MTTIPTWWQKISCRSISSRLEQRNISLIQKILSKWTKYEKHWKSNKKLYLKPIILSDIQGSKQKIIFKFEFVYESLKGLLYMDHKIWSILYDLQSKLAFCRYFSMANNLVTNIFKQLLSYLRQKMHFPLVARYALKQFLITMKISYIHWK